LALSTGWKKISPFTLIGVFVVLVLLNFETLFAIRDHLPVKPLTILFQKSLNFGVVPGDWKLANVSPIYKGKVGRDNVANYRPISVTNCFIKILEKIIFKHPVWSLEERQH
jgi:hypothetical protein